MAVNERSLANLQPPFFGKDDPRCAKAYTPEANAKRSETMKKKSAERRRRNKIADDLRYILSLPLSDAANLVEDISKIETFRDLGKEENATVQDAILKALIINAKNGDTKAFEIIRDTTGEKPADVKVNVLEDAAKNSMAVAEALFSDDEEKKEEEE